MVPMHGRKAEGAFHEPERRPPARRNRYSTGFVRAGPEFGAPVHGEPHQDSRGTMSTIMFLLLRRLKTRRHNGPKVNIECIQQPW